MRSPAELRRSVLQRQLLASREDCLLAALLLACVFARPLAGGEPPLLSAEPKRDALGNRYLEVAGKVEKVEIDSRHALLGVAPAPDGSEVYMICAGRSEVIVCDPATLRPTGSFSVPRYPVAIWCDETHLLVASSESGVVVVFERATRKPLHSLHYSEPASHPYGLGGKSSDGTWLSLWTRSLKGRTSFEAVGHTLSGPVWSFSHSERAIRWAHLGPQERILTSTARGSQLWNRRTAAPIGKFRDDLGSMPLFPTRDGKSLVSARLGRPPGFGVETYLLDWSLRESSQVPIPGLVVTELLDPAVFVVCESVSRAPPARGPELQVVYLERETGLPQRRVVFPPSAFPPQRLTPGTYCFVPKTERIVSWQADNGRGGVVVIACGPVEGALATASAPEPRPGPPLKVKVGERIEFTPAFSAGEGKQVSFALEAGPPGAAINDRTGAFSWTPGELSLGRWDVEIWARVDGVRQLVARWVIEAESE